MNVKSLEKLRVIPVAKFIDDPWVIERTSIVGKRRLSPADSRDELTKEIDARIGFAVEKAFLEALKELNFDARPSDDVQHDVEVKLPNETLRIDLKTIIRAARASSISRPASETISRNFDVIYVVYDAREGDDATFVGWDIGANFEPSRYQNGGSYIMTSNLIQNFDFLLPEDPCSET